MARYSIEDTTLTNIADAIRSKTGSTESIMVSDMPDQISSISGVKSWNDLEDKPFYDENVTIEWDGNTEGHLVNNNLVKVSEHTPTKDELVGGKWERFVVSTNETVTTQIDESNFVDYSEYGYPVTVSWCGGRNSL